MNTTLISFLGGNKPKGYDKVRYQFPDGSIRETEYFALALKDHLQSSGALEKLILLGTDTSMWDVFSYSHYDDNTQVEVSAIIEEMGAKGKATQESLDKLSKKLSASFKVTTQCILIPYARDSSEQAEILTSLANAVESNGNIVLDVTHGLRHLSMLALIAARYLKHVRHVNIQDVYYGAFELGGKVINLKGMLQMLDWVEALAVYDRSGDYGVFAPLFEDDGMEPEHAAMLGRAAYFERVGNIKKAKNCLDRVQPVIETIDAHKEHGKYSLGSLFGDALIKRLEWKDLSRQQQEVALYERHLERGDYLRAAIFLQESVVTRLVEQRGQRGFHHQGEERRVRKAASDALIQSESKGGIHAFWELSNLRNAMAHGRRDGIMRDDTVDAFETPENLKKKLMTLRETIDKALKKRTPRWEHVQDDKGCPQPVLYLDK